MFAHVVGRPDAEIDLAEAALLIAETEYPGLPIARYTGMLDELGRTAADIVAQPSDRPGIERVLRYLYEEARFRGNADDYYDPKNSFLNEVLERRVGIPITLALVVTEVCKRARVEAQGVSFPGHFLVRSPAPNGLYVADPFEGKLMTQAASPRQIVVRMLNNLRGIYANRGDREREREMLERLFILSPTDEIKRDLDAAGGERAVSAGSRALN
jgi:regulator of sirC expression with transglutaminase-like and TPR domain